MNRVFIILILLAMSTTACQSQTPETVKYVDLEKYSGVWFEIAAFPTRFEKGCSNTTAEYQDFRKKMEEKGFDTNQLQTTVHKEN